MANRRMFSLNVINTDIFLDMPISAQCLYFHLGMRADDDGFVSSPKQIMRMTTCTQGDMKILAESGFLIPFKSGIVVIRHWKQHNYLRSDRYRKTIYSEERAALELVDNIYKLEKENIHTSTNANTSGIPLVEEMETQDRIGKDRIGKDRLELDIICSEPELPPIRSGILLILNDKSFYDVSLEKIALWKDTYPAVDVEQELKKMVAWCDSNPQKRKTKKGIERFINNWLSKEQDKGGVYKNSGRQQSNKSKNSFNQFQQNDYDFDTLEKELLDN